ncbi:hypothetical protein P5V15_012925 [Pogonomyrmex californicus]
MAAISMRNENLIPNKYRVSLPLMSILWHRRARFAGWLMDIYGRILEHCPPWKFFGLLMNAYLISIVEIDVRWKFNGAMEVQWRSTRDYVLFHVSCRKDLKNALLGIETDAEKLKKVISELNGKPIDELISKGREKLSSMPIGGAVAAGATVAPAGGVAAPVEEKKEEKKPAKEESESEDDDMGFGLFD